MKFISLGHNCVPAELLKTNGHKTESYPFDWARSNICSVIDILEFGKQYHIETNIYRKNSKFYEQKCFKNIFYPHHDYTRDTEYFCRCADRFFDVLQKSTEHVKFIYMSNYQHQITDSELSSLISAFDKFETLDYEVIMIYYRKCGKSVQMIDKGIKYRKYLCDAPNEFMSNPMRPDPFYKELFCKVFDEK